MKIIDRNKDYYDYLAYQSGDDFPVFDRRGSVLLTKQMLCDVINRGDGGYYYSEGRKISAPLVPYNKYISPFEKRTPIEELFFLVVLAAGVNIFFLKWNKLCYENKETLCDFSMELFCKRKWYEYTGAPLALYTVNPFSFPFGKAMSVDWKRENMANISLDPLLQQNGGLSAVPILQGAGFASVISPEEIYFGIDEYLLAAKNDKPMESAGLTDTDKAINHGFDKRTSFRNVK